MEEKLRRLEEDNRRLCEALRQIAEHSAEITRLTESVRDILDRDAVAPDAPVTDETVKNLLKKYSRI